MPASIITVGDELLAGEITNTNAAWLAARLDDRGMAVAEIVTLPDDVTVVADRISRHRAAHDATIVTGGVGGTPDDVTMDAVARAFDCELTVDPAERERIAARVAEVREDRPSFDLDLDAWAATPAAGEALSNPAGLSPGCVVDDIYVLPGVPDEMRAMFEARAAAAFAGDGRSLTIHATGSESEHVETLETVRERFGVSVGCYPDGEVKRLTLRGDGDAPLEAARDWLADELDDQLVADPPGTDGD